MTKQEWHTAELHRIDHTMRRAGVTLQDLHAFRRGLTTETLQIRDYFAKQVSRVTLAREAGVSRQFIHSITAGDEQASEKVVAAARRLGVLS